jgi:AcrR family transcriptional regulator
MRRACSLRRERSVINLSTLPYCAMKVAPTIIARTQSALVNALAELARDRPVRTLTVKDLIERAQIGRSPFYEHFGCVESLLC